MLVLAGAQSRAPQPTPIPDPGPPARVPPPSSGSPPSAPPMGGGHGCRLPRLPKLPCPKLPCPKLPRPPACGARGASPAPAAPADKLQFDTAHGTLQVESDASPARKLQVAGAVVAARLQDAADQIVRDLSAIAQGRRP